MRNLLAIWPLEMSQQYYHEHYGDAFVHSGIGLGSVVAVVLSWERNKSIAWAILHGIFGWLYVIYFALTRKVGE